MIILFRAKLPGADLQEADLTGANLQEADLTGASLYKTILRFADLQGANISGAIMECSSLTCANLEKVKFDPRNPPKMARVILQGAENIPRSIMDLLHRQTESLTASIDELA